MCCYIRKREIDPLLLILTFDKANLPSSPWFIYLISISCLHNWKEGLSIIICWTLQRRVRSTVPVKPRAESNLEPSEELMAATSSANSDIYRSPHRMMTCGQQERAQNEGTLAGAYLVADSRSRRGNKTKEVDRERENGLIKRCHLPLT